MGKYYLSKNYKEKSSAGNKAKTDIEKILSSEGYKNAGFAQTNYSNKFIGFILTFTGVLKVLFTISANDIVVVQYPLKKYYTFVCRLIHFKRGKVITVIHDLGTFRRKKLTKEKEISRLNFSDVLIVHNYRMKEWLSSQGYSKPMICLEIFDYLSATQNRKKHEFTTKPVRVIYAGGLGFRKNKFLYDLDHLISEWRLELFGSGFDDQLIKNKQHFIYNGFCPSDQLIENAGANFGLVWDGDSTTSCSGNFGAYLKLNNPHKVSLYIRCNCPVIIWEEAALASFVRDNKIGICVGSLEELNTVLSSLSHEGYDEMLRNVAVVNKKIAEGYYIKKALVEAAMYI